MDSKPLLRKRFERGLLLSLGILFSALLHIAFLVWAFGIPAPPPLVIQQKIPVRIEFKAKSKEKEKDQASRETERREPKQIVEAPLLPTEAPDQPAYLGAQNHRTDREQKTVAGRGAPGAPATALQSGALRLERVPDRGGRIKVPQKNDYASLLPQSVEVINPGHNDYIQDADVPVGAVLDVNTTDFRFLSYFIAVRKQVDLAYYDVGPTLRESPHVRERMAQSSKIRFQGSSVVQLKVMRSGVLVESKLNQSSGDKEIDEFWLRVLNLAAPYPPLPRSYPGDELTFTYSLYYDLVYQDQQRTKRLVF